jgi:hypothetical protein
MNKVVLLLVLLPYQALSQISFDFETGTASGWTESAAGRWAADMEGSLTGIYSLHHVFDNSTGAYDCAGIRLTDLHPSEGDTRWSFSLKHGCDPSASNSWAMFLISDTDPLMFENGSAASGFAVGVNLFGYDDTLRLWKLDSGAASVVAACPLNWQNDIGTSHFGRISVRRMADGSWTIEVADEEHKLLGEGRGYDPYLPSAAWMILNYRYTSTRDRLLWLDDVLVEGVFYEDRIAPVITGIRVTARNEAEITFDEDPSDEILNISLFSVKGTSLAASAVTRKRTRVVGVCFEEDFPNRIPCTLVISRLCDRQGNCADDAESVFTPVWAEPGDIVISEIMADPLPVVSLPPAEYLEIYNRTDLGFDLKNWSLSTESSKYPLPEIFIGPGEYIILCSQSAASYLSVYGRSEGLKAFPALTDAGRIIFLSDSSGQLIHGLEYSSAWYGDKLKAEGGWSLEMTDTGYPFYASGNWEASLSVTGGTPGQPNASPESNPDNYFRGLENVFPESGSLISIVLSETLFGLEGSPSKIVTGGPEVLSVVAADPLLRRFEVSLKEPLTEGTEYYFLLTGGMNDFAGNEIERRSFVYGLPEAVRIGDVVFNELLFNPFSGDPDYIELVNISRKIIDASRLWLASVSVSSGDTSSAVPLSSEGRCILPGDYYVTTSDPKKVIERYTSGVPDKIHAAPALPSMPDDRGHLLLLSREMNPVDDVIYTEKMHYSLLSEREGISLEKIRPELLSDESTSWHSASESAGWGTPGKVNSVFSGTTTGGDMIRLSSATITPDNNGYEDVLLIDFDLSGAGNVVTVTIYDERGGFVRRIAENFLAGERASLVWDATAGDGSLVRRGIYIIFIELFDAAGKKDSWKKVCSVIR